MLDEFKDEQPIIYKTLINSVSSNKCTHSIIFETKNYSKSLDFAKSFCKFVLCPNKFTKINESCGSCNQCDLIDNNEFIELKIIEPDGQYIKKTQLDELQKSFSKKTIIGKNKIYIINHSERLNASSSNSLLKFLEDPQEGIIGILIVDDINKLLPTIVSRCQVFSFRKNKCTENENTASLIANYMFNNKNDILTFLKDNENNNVIGQAVEFIKNYEEKKLDTIVYINTLFPNIFKDKDNLNNLFAIMTIFYNDVLNISLGNKIEFFLDYEDDLKIVKEKNNIDKLINKINVIIDLQNKIKYNANVNMLIDKLIIMLEGE